MPRLALIAVTARTASFSLDADQCDYFLGETHAWGLQTAAGSAVGEGVTTQVVKTLHGLQPGTDYRLRCEGEELVFTTKAETAQVTITSHGASPALDDNAEPIQQAIDALPPGATLVIPAGTFRSGPLFLKSRMTLLLEEGAVLLGHDDRSRYKILPARHADGRVLGTWEGVAEPCFGSLLTAIDCEDLIITGKGIVDGGADRADWWTWPKETRNGARRPRTVFLSNCTNAVLTGVTVRNSPAWTVHPVFCRNLMAADLHILNDPLSPNTDGMNPECSQDVQLRGIHFSVGDDCIAIKAGKLDPKGGLDVPCERISVENCHMERGHGGVVIGSEMSGSVREVMVRRCSMHETDRGLRIKTRRGRGGCVENITLEDCHMDRVAMPFVINAFYFCDADGRSDYVQSRQPLPVGENTPQVRHIAVRNVVSTNTAIAAAAFYGLPEAPIQGITIQNYRVSFDPAAKPDVPDMACGFEPMRHAGIVSENAIFDLCEGVEIAPIEQSNCP